MVSAQIYDHAARRRSFEILAGVNGKTADVGLTRK
jgi:hypothetical protein